MTCPDCDRSRAGMWCGYSASCTDCKARAIARSLDAFNALDPRGSRARDPLRELIQRAIPDADYATARRKVWEWWLHDHPDAKVHAP